MENKKQTQFNIDEEAINAFVEKHVRKSQREETAAILRWMNGKNISDIFDEGFREAYKKEKAVL